MQYDIVTILSENEEGQIGHEEWSGITDGMLKGRIGELEKEGWAVQEVQVDEDQHAIPWYEMYFKDKSETSHILYKFVVEMSKADNAFIRGKAIELLERLKRR